MKRLGISKVVFDMVMVFLMVGIEVESLRAEFKFSTPENLGPPINTSYSEGTPCISPDGLSLYFTSNRGGGSGLHDLWVTTRTSQQEGWSAPTNLGPQVNSSTLDYFPNISSDGLSLYFYSLRSGGRGGGDLWMTTRASPSSSWTTAVNVGSHINSTVEEVSPHLSGDGLTLYFASNRSGGYGDYDMYYCTRVSVGSAWSSPINMGSTINSTSLDVAPTLMPDGLVLFFHSQRSGGQGSYDLYVTQRTTVNDPWSTPVNLGSPVNSSYSELGPSICGDGLSLYFCDHYMLPARPGGYGADDIWQVTIRPEVDGNGDGIVNLRDFSQLAQFWGQHAASMDIAPAPLGDGQVDALDLMVLYDNWLAEMGLAAYWKLDEQTGPTAYNSVDDPHGTLQGDPCWVAGYRGGGLSLDGINDYVEVPNDERINVSQITMAAWVKAEDATPDSHMFVLNRQMTNVGTYGIWLNPTDHKWYAVLRLDWNESAPITIYSDAAASTDWTHIAATYDGSDFKLYINGTLQSETQHVTGSIDRNNGGILSIGSHPSAGLHFQGMIDEVLIYDRALSIEGIQLLAK